MNHVPSWAAGIALAVIVALLAFRARSLSRTGALAAAVLGAIAMGAGWSWGVLLVVYFASSSLLSRFRSAEKDARTEGRIEKGGTRDATQVLANGGVFALSALGFWIEPLPVWQVLGAGALAASAADTWATELGILAPRAPRSILTWRPVDTGTSGGVTTQGFAAGAAGAALVTIVVWALRWPPVAVLGAFLGGLFGCVLDSVVGASLQSRRFCTTCGVATEQRVHRCASPTEHTGGLRLLDNDGVNFVATVGGALFGATVTSLF